ncbi:MAG: 3-hydroxy-3-methylglutaryl-CoA lyase [Lachnospiraceae bacterium]|nr:3-hydroxy-3-methylglutaryl-CoA lyase [Lachnospiraceae bacterium]
MGRIQVLDCTLRDGGYCNNWEFGQKNISLIMDALTEANVDIVECGYLTEASKELSDSTQYASLNSAEKKIPENYRKMAVCMINYGEYSLERIPVYDEGRIAGIRIAFHKKDLQEAMEYCRGIRKKGYQVFVQPMLTSNYSEEEFLQMIELANKVQPYAVYIVDSFGGMKERELLRLFYMLEHRLAKEIKIGFHSHNNMQLAYSNAKSLISVQTKRNLIVDSSIFGMGRGAGNLNTELLTEHLNECEDASYQLSPLLSVIDRVLSDFYKENYWGYSIANYLSARHNAHPNYARHLDGKSTLTIESMNEIFSIMEESKKANYDGSYIENLYIHYMGERSISDDNFQNFAQVVKDSSILIIAPGISSRERKEEIQQCAERTKCISIGVNFDYPYLKTDYIFLSNMRRYRELNKESLSRCISTSNIAVDDVYLKVDYAKLLNNVDGVRDNAALMLIKLLITLEAKEIYIAGIDGYSHDRNSNYADRSMSYAPQLELFEVMNKGLSTMLNAYAAEIPIHFITSPRYIDVSLMK